MDSNNAEHNAVQKLLGKSPSWMLRWGILLVAFFFIIAIFLFWFIQYPDTIRADVQLHRQTLPVRLTMPVDGSVDSLLIHNLEGISEGQLLAILRSSAQFEDVLLLESFCKDWNPSKNKIPESASNLKLGTITSLWSSFLIHQKELNYFYQNDISVLKKNNLEQQIAKFEELNRALLQQKTTLQKSVDLARKAKERDEALLADKSASALEVNQSTATFLKAQQVLEQHSNGIIQNELQIERLRAEMLEIAFVQKKDATDKVLQLQKDIQEIQAAIEIWKQEYLIYAPIEGTITISSAWTLRQNLAVKTPLFSILPNTSNTEEVKATAFVSNRNFGKINKGAAVQIQLEAYPYQEFGVLEGLVESIPAIAENGRYEILIRLEEPLRTSYDKMIPFRHELKGKAIIITQKRRLAERLFDKIWSALKN